MISYVEANTSWFTFESQSGDFGVYAFTGREEANVPYEFSIELVSLSAREDITGLLGTEALLSIKDRSHGGRDKVRREGFELRTDGWGGRSAKGLYATTYERSRASCHHKDMRETVSTVQSAVEQHYTQSEFAVEHSAQDELADMKKTIDSLKKQLEEIRGTEAHKLDSNAKVIEFLVKKGN